MTIDVVGWPFYGGISSSMNSFNKFLVDVPDSSHPSWTTYRPYKVSTIILIATHSKMVTMYHLIIRGTGEEMPFRRKFLYCYLLLFNKTFYYLLKTSFIGYRQ